MCAVDDGGTGGSDRADASPTDAAASDGGVFVATGSMAEARQGHTATLLPNGKVLIAGGAIFESDGSAETYDPAAGIFSATGSMVAARYFHTATLLGNGRVLLAGGFGLNNALTSAELYDPAAGTFTATGDMG